MKILLKDKFLLIYSSLFFLVSSVLGIYFVLSIGTGNEISTSDFTNIYKKREGWSGATFFFIQNIKVSLLLISGILIFGSSTILVLIINGFWLGSVLGSQYLGGLGIKELFFSIAPHGVFEIPALILAGYIGLTGSKFYFQKNNWKKLSVVSCIIVILLMIAALIEGFLTPNQL